MKPAARVGDNHTCPMEAPEVHEGGAILGPAATKVHIGGTHAARVSDLADCKPDGFDDVLAQGAATVLVEGLYAARKTDATAHGGEIVEGMDTVLIGGAEFKARKVEVLLDAATGEWQVRYGSSIVIRPDASRPPLARDATFQTRALQSLVALDTTPTMHGAFDALEATGRTVTLVRYQGEQGPNGAYQHDASMPDAYADGVVVDDGTRCFVGTGEGTDSTVHWSPDVHAFDDGADAPVPWARPGATVVLAHEMLHGLHSAQGTTAVGPGADYRVASEREVTGLDARTYGPDDDHPQRVGAPLPSTRDLPFTENRVRADFRERGIPSPATGRPPLDRPSYSANGEPY